MTAIVCLLLCACAAVALQSTAADAERKADEAYSRAVAASSAQDKVRYFRESLRAVRTFPAALGLGHALLEADACGEALDAFQDALQIAGTPEARSDAWVGCAEASRCLKRLIAAAQFLREAIDIHPDPARRQRLEAALRKVETEQAGSVASAEEISAFFRASRAFRVRPKIDMRVQFKFDSVELSDTGEQQVMELGKALQQQQSSSRFRLVGHTDTQGDAAYNDRLSLRRAEALRDFLARNFQFAPNRFEVSGMGERQPLYPGEDEETHALNRRVEVELN
jgi:outer membrane protein OmpA-like peptidoglycan-associated protein